MCMQTHTLGFHVLLGHSIDIMAFILYKLYIISPYTSPTPKSITQNFLCFCAHKKKVPKRSKFAVIPQRTHAAIVTLH